MTVTIVFNKLVWHLYLHICIRLRLVNVKIDLLSVSADELPVRSATILVIQNIRARALNLAGPSFVTFPIYALQLSPLHSPWYISRIIAEPLSSRIHSTLVLRRLDGEAYKVCLI
jgi:hypothetical protein